MGLLPQAIAAPAQYLYKTGLYTSKVPELNSISKASKALVAIKPIVWRVLPGVLMLIIF
jgi:hypothetical protein